MNSKQIWRTLTTGNYASDMEGVGSLRMIGEKLFRFVKNDGAADLALGELAYHTLSNQSTMFQNVGRCATANLSALGGVVVATDGIKTTTGTNCYGWIQVMGYNASISCSGGTTGGADILPGEHLKGSNGAVYAIRDTTAPTYRRAIQILETVTTTTTPAAAYVKGHIMAM